MSTRVRPFSANSPRATHPPADRPAIRASVPNDAPALTWGHQECGAEAPLRTPEPTHALRRHRANGIQTPHTDYACATESPH